MENRMKNERAILKAFAKRDDKVIKQFINEHYRKIETYLKSKGATEYDVEEIMQQALITLFDVSKTKGFELKGKVVEYFFGVVKYLFNHRIRDIKSKEIYDNEAGKNIADEEILIDKLITINESYEFIEKVLEKIGKDCKKLFELIVTGTKTSDILKEMEYSHEYFYKKRSLCKKNLLIKLSKDRKYRELFKD